MTLDPSMITNVMRETMTIWGSKSTVTRLRTVMRHRYSAKSSSRLTCRVLRGMHPRTQVRLDQHPRHVLVTIGRVAKHFLPHGCGLHTHIVWHMRDRVFEPAQNGAIHFDP